MEMVMGLDIGGTAIKAAGFDSESGVLLDKLTVPTLEGREGFHHACLELIEALESSCGRMAEAIGLAAPGLVEKEGRFVSSMPGRLRGLEGLRWSEALGREVSLLNDAHAALLGEVWQGAARGVDDAILLTLGTGVGGAILSGGQLLRGHLGRAGHLGHISLDLDGEPDICGARGSLEDFVGNHNISERTGGRFDTTLSLVEAVRLGDMGALRVWDRSMEALGAGIVSLINVLDPEVVIIGGGISRAWEEIEPVLSAYLDENEWRPEGNSVKLREAELGEWAGTYGAAWQAIRGR